MNWNDARTSGRKSKNARIASSEILLFTTSRRSSNSHQHCIGRGRGYFEDIVVCLFDPFVGKHFDGGFLCVWVAITETPSEDPFTVTDTQDAEVAYFVHTARVDASTINRVNVSCTFNNKQYRCTSLFKVKQDGSSNLTFISTQL